MGRKKGRTAEPGQHKDQTDWDSERTLGAAEEESSFGDGAEDEGLTPGGAAVSDTSCPCGSNEFLLEAYLQVTDGVIQKELVEVERLTCPQCGREYEAIQGEGGKILRGDFMGYAELE